MKIIEGLYYAENHEWVNIEDGVAVMGVSDYAQSELGDVVFVELPDNGENYEKSEQFVVIESVKTVSDVYMPLSGEIIEVNESLLDNPELINDDPYENGWIVKIKYDDKSELEQLMDSDEYKSFLEEL